MLLLSLSVLFGSSMILENAEARTASLKQQMAARGEAELTISEGQTAVYLGTVGENTVEICEAEETQDPGLFAWIYTLAFSGR